MGPGGAPQKSIFEAQKWHFPDFLFWGSVEGRGGCNSRTLAHRLQLQSSVIVFSSGGVS